MIVANLNDGGDGHQDLNLIDFGIANNPNKKLKSIMRLSNVLKFITVINRYGQYL